MTSGIVAKPLFHALRGRHDTGGSVAKPLQNRAVLSFKVAFYIAHRALERSKTVTENDSIEPETSGSGDPGQGGARMTRGIRFSDPEWEEVKKAAEERGVPAGKLVRDAVLDLARGRVNDGRT